MVGGGRRTNEMGKSCTQMKSSKGEGSPSGYFVHPGP